MCKSLRRAQGNGKREVELGGSFVGEGKKGGGGPVADLRGKGILGKEIWVGRKEVGAARKVIDQFRQCHCGKREGNEPGI